tara:strand:+ start:3303 stop:3479 length:177 start_codon:yes stop_codon:yes gene_type:complete
MITKKQITSIKERLIRRIAQLETHKLQYQKDNDSVNYLISDAKLTSFQLVLNDLNDLL